MYWVTLLEDDCFSISMAIFIEDNKLKMYEFIERYNNGVSLPVNFLNTVWL